MGSDPSGRGVGRGRVRKALAVALSGALVAVAARRALRRGQRTTGDAEAPSGDAGTAPSEPTTSEPTTSEPTTPEPTTPEPTPSEPAPVEAVEETVVPPAPTEASPAPAESGPAELDAPPEPARARRRAVRAMVTLVVLLVAAGIAVPFVHGGKPRNGTGTAFQRSGDARHPKKPAAPETVASVLPATGTTGVTPDTTIAVTFSQPLAPDAPAPTLSPAVAGAWQVVGTSEMLFTPTASFVPSARYTVTVPGGTTGVRAADGRPLAQPVSSSFTIAPGSVVRLQQLLATLGYLPVAFSGPTPPAPDMALTQLGTYTWRVHGFPASYTSLWSPTRFTALTKGAVMAFETQSGLAVDGVAGPAVWGALLRDAVAAKKDTAPLTYVLVTKTLPEHLTVWVNGVLTFAHVPCNTGVPGATTTDGTYSVFEHVQVSNMRGTDITGTQYDVTVPWASYFNGGQALHGYPRASYGFPQSNGCVEMPITTAGRVWPSTPIGTIVTVE